MSFSVTLFGPRHYWWRAFKAHERVWLHRPDRYSTGGVGFCIPGLHMCFTWGATAHEPHTDRPHAA